MRADRGEDDHLPLQIAHGETPVRLSLHGLADVPVLVVGLRELVVRTPQGLAVGHALVILPRVGDQAVHLVPKPFVHEARALVAVQQGFASTGDRLHVLQEDRHEEEHVLRHVLLEVCVLQGVAGVRARGPDRIRRELRDDVCDREEVAFRLRHLLVVDKQPAVAEEALGPHVRLLLPDAGVVVQGHRQVVLNEVLARDAEVHGVPKPELLPHLLQHRLRDLRLLRLGAVQEHEVPDLVREVLRLDALWAALGSVQYTTLQHVRHRVVRHVDRAVRQRLDDELLVPRHLRAEAERSAASPLLQPADGVAEGVLDALVVRAEGRGQEMVFDLLAPRLLAVLQVPLVDPRDDALVP
mmetsp:Transcript_13690/g.36919  ORF Transcript_13690/g.36919 Transcript_13690/m.36919 type:complete len:354 (+) Transcript_13690:1044-2105(+)